MSTKIEWANKTWNPTTGCEKISPGCENCYAINMTNRLQGIEHSREKYQGSVERTKAGRLNWTGQVKEHSEDLYKPDRWKSPQRIFVGSMSDIFHPDVSFTFLSEIFRTIHKNNHHTFMVLTKRPARLVQYWNFAADEQGMSPEDFGKYYVPNLWVGTSVENQEQADNRIPELLEVPATIRFLSCEPLLEYIDLTRVNPRFEQDDEGSTNVLIGERIEWPYRLSTRKINWVIVGGESGPKARPVHPEWVRSVRDQCERSRTPFFFKQWGSYLPYTSLTQNGAVTKYLKAGKETIGRELDSREYNEFPSPTIQS